MSKRIQDRISYQTWMDVSNELEMIGIKGKKKYQVLRLIHDSIDRRSGYRSQTMSDYYYESLNEFIKLDSKGRCK